MRQWLPALALLVALAAPALADEPSSPFRTAAVKKGPLTVMVKGTGTVEPEEVVDIGANVKGVVKQFGKDAKGKTIDYGSEVEAGAILAELDPTLYQIQLDKAKADLRRAEAEHRLSAVKLQQAERELAVAMRLDANKAISREDVERTKGIAEVARATVQVSEAAVDQAKVGVSVAETHLGYTKIRTPVKGVVIDRRFNLGQSVVADLNAPSLFLIAPDLSKLHVWMAVPEASIGQVNVGQRARFTIDAFPGETFEGKVLQVRLNATMTQGVVTYTVVISVDNPKGKLLPYLTANVELAGAQRKDVLQVPEAALRWRPESAKQVVADERRNYEVLLLFPPRQGRGIIFVEEKGLVRPYVVRIGQTGDGVVEIVEGGPPEGKPVVIGLKSE